MNEGIMNEIQHKRQPNEKRMIKRKTEHKKAVNEAQMSEDDCFVSQRIYLNFQKSFVFSVVIFQRK